MDEELKANFDKILKELKALRLENEEMKRYIQGTHKRANRIYDDIDTIKKQLGIMD